MLAKSKKFDRQMLGFDIEPWLIALRGHTLVMLGRGDEARPYLDRVIEMAAASVDVTHHIIPSVAYVDLAWTDGDAHLADRHSERAFSRAMKSGSPYLRVYAQACRGLSHIVAGRVDEAVRDLVDALGSRVGEKLTGRRSTLILAGLANTYRIKGDFTVFYFHRGRSDYDFHRAAHSRRRMSCTDRTFKASRALVVRLARPRSGAGTRPSRGVSSRVWCCDLCSSLSIPAEQSSRALRSSLLLLLADIKSAGYG